MGAWQHIDRLLQLRNHSIEVMMRAFTSEAYLCLCGAYCEVMVRTGRVEVANGIMLLSHNKAWLDWPTTGRRSQISPYFDALDHDRLDNLTAVLLDAVCKENLDWCISS